MGALNMFGAMVGLAFVAWLTRDDGEIGLWIVAALFGVVGIGLVIL